MENSFLKGISLDLVLWRLQRSTALLALFLVFLHLILQLIIFRQEVISFEAVSFRLKSYFLLAIDVVLLIVVSIHGFLGFRSILQDYAHKSAASRVITIISILIIIFTILYGLVALLAFI